MRHTLPYILILLFCTACDTVVPENAVKSDEKPLISPDYAGLAIPCNIQPLDFTICTDGESFITRITGENAGEITVAGRNVRFDTEQWRKLLSENAGGDLRYSIYVRRNGKWLILEEFTNHVAAEPIDEYLTYRLLAPSYEFYTAFSIRQRNLSTGEDREVYNNRMHYTPKAQQCMNCHQFQNYRTENWQMHIRQILGGTLIVTGDKSVKVNLKTKYTMSAGVYPAWHPTDRVIAYSVNRTRQFFHEKNIHKLEVQDPASDLILYDIDSNQVNLIAADTSAFETFPAWSPDGNTLYFSSAQQPEIARLPSDSIAICFDKIYYDIVRMDYDRIGKKFTDPKTVVDARSMERSALLPRISPDGRYLLYSLGEYGTFHIWHRGSDLWVKNLETGDSYPLDTANSPDADSYHNWSSNGRWIVFTSRRDDGLFTRTYFAYFDADGHAHKAFMLPPKDFSGKMDRVLSYNIPEFSIEPIRQSPRELSRMIEQDAVKAEFSQGE